MTAVADFMKLFSNTAMAVSADMRCNGRFHGNSITKFIAVSQSSEVVPNPARLMQRRKLFVIKPASSAVYNKYNAETLRYFR